MSKRSPSRAGKSLLSLDDVLKHRLPLKSVFQKPAEHFFGVQRINRAYHRLQQYGEEELREHFFEHALREFELRYHVEDADLERIPKTGPVVVVANLPQGLADGLVLGDLLTRLRPDVRFVAVEAFLICPELQPWIIDIDRSSSDEARKRNVAGVRETLRFLNEGGLVVVFPAGAASSFCWRDRRITDDPWKENIAALIRLSKATVVPVHLSGRTSLLFQGMSLLNKSSQGAMLARELRRASKRLQWVRISQAMNPTQVKHFKNDRDLMSNLRLRTYLMGREASEKVRRRNAKRGDDRFPDIIAPIPTVDLVTEVQQLPENQLLLRSGNFAVYHALADQIPKLLREIGRLREITFRSVGEGSGNDCDLDEFDQDYQHLFLWDTKEHCLAGAYRMGQTDLLLEKRGIAGLYNSQFFDFDIEVLKRISPGLEMGRSFIVQAYQRKPLTLGLIWQGIGQFISRHPHYRYLFGVVSTSNTYSGVSRGLIVEFLKEHAMDKELAAMIRARNPPKSQQLAPSERDQFSESCPDPDGLSSLVSAIEADGKGLPVLLRQYLKLNGRILSFNIDKDFGNVLDCLILVDIHQSPPRSLKRYLGSEAVEAILKQGGTSRQSSDR